MASYNGERFVREQLDSILSQMNERDEIIISDDGSTDATVEIVNSYDDPRVRLKIGERNKGPIENFEFALSFVLKDIVVLADQDDVWLDGRLDFIRSHFSRLKGDKYHLLHLDSVPTDVNLVSLRASTHAQINSGSGILKNI